MTDIQTTVRVVEDRPVGRCRCGRQSTQDGAGCQWHTAVQAQVLRDIAALVNENPEKFQAVADVLTERRD